jgi:hypothetical protein
VTPTSAPVIAVRYGYGEDAADTVG